MSNIKTKYQKIIKVGNSYAVTLDSDFIKRNNLRDGNIMAASYRTDQPGVSFVPQAQESELDGDAMTQTFKKSTLAASITPEFVDWVEKTLEDDKESMEKLANLS